MKQTIFGDIPDNLPNELLQDIVKAPGMRIERIVSRGHSSPQQGWYDQAENEWVMLVQGAARLSFCTQGSVQTLHLAPGDYVTIPAHCKHKVDWTDPEQTTVWLAVFYAPNESDDLCN